MLAKARLFTRLSRIVRGVLVLGLRIGVFVA